MNSRPVKHLQQFSKLYPNAWQTINIYYDALSRHRQKYPCWCFLPSDLFCHIGSNHLNMGQPQMDFVDDYSTFMALSKWRITQGIYRFDPTLEHALINSPLRDNLPVAVFYKLPEWCIYIETHDMQFFGEKIHGIFVHLGYHRGRDHNELRIMLDGECGFVPFNILLGDWSLECAIDRLFAMGHLSEIMPKSIDLKQLSSVLASVLSPFLALIIYLCSEKPDYSGGIVRSAGYPSPKKTKQGLKFFPPDKPKIVEVGNTIGQQLRAPTNYIGTSSGSRTVKPHIRRGHWHHYWKGPRKGGKENQELIVVWLPPTAVNANDFLINGWDRLVA